MSQNQRYQWVGELEHDEARKLIASSDLLVISSLSEGGAAIIGEAVVAGTPILSTRIDGVTGLLGDNYAGYFEVGDTEGLATLMTRAESELQFRKRLQNEMAQVVENFSKNLEIEAWGELLRSLS